MRAGREGEGDRCVYVPLVAPLHSPSLPTEGRTDAHDIDFGEATDREPDKEKGGREGDVM